MATNAPDDRGASTTPDASSLDPATLDEVERALNISHHGGEPYNSGTTDGGIPQAETLQPDGGIAHPNGGIPVAETGRPGGGVARPHGGIPHAETVRDGGITYPNYGGIPAAETTRPGGGVAQPNGGIPQAEPVESGAVRPRSDEGYLDSDEPVRTSDRRPSDFDG